MRFAVAATSYIVLDRLLARIWVKLAIFIFNLFNVAISSLNFIVSRARMNCEACGSGESRSLI